MAGETAKPVIFISYSHRDEPDHPREGEVQWLSFVRTYLQPAIKFGVFDLWVDRHLPGGADLDPEIEHSLRTCDIFILLVSAYSMASDYIVDREIAAIRERQVKGEDVHFYPLLLTPTPDAALDKVKDKNLRPRDAKPFSRFPYHERLDHMNEAANEIAKIARQIAKRKGGTRPSTPSAQPAYVHISGLPETAYERLVGREEELKRLDEAWADPKTNILSLIAEGGAGKSALVNEWLKRLQADNYRGAEAVLGWSFYSQGTKERTTSADEFLNWALDKLGTKPASTSAKAEAIAEAIMRRRVLLLLDGVEPLQHGPGPQLGQLKDFGLRAVLRRFAATPPGAAHALVVLTSRLAVKDIARWQHGAAPVVDLDRLSGEAGAALLRDNGVWGTDKELKTAAHDFGGHPLALGLLASFLKETQTGDVRRRDHIRAFFADPENPRHDHAKRVMESYEKEWLADQPVLLAIMHMVGLFDRPASDDNLRVLRKKPVIKGLTEHILELDDIEWQRAITRLRELRLLAPPDPSEPDALDVHPVVREWFSERMQQETDRAWRTAHGRLYEHLRDTTEEGKMPTLEQLGPLYQAVAHGCHAGKHQATLETIYRDRICRRLSPREPEFYSIRKLGAVGSDLSAISWFFERPYEVPVGSLNKVARNWVLSHAAYCLRAQGRFAEALPAHRAAFRMLEFTNDWHNTVTAGSNLSEAELLAGGIEAALASGKKAIEYADQHDKKFPRIFTRTTYADALLAAGRLYEAEQLLEEAERQHQQRLGFFPLLLSLQGYRYCNLLLAKGAWAAARDRAQMMIEVQEISDLLDLALVRLALGRAHFGILCEKRNPQRLSDLNIHHGARSAFIRLDEATNGFQSAGQTNFVPRGLLARAAFRRSVGDWDGAARDLDEVEEIAEPGPMRLYLCDMTLERARLAFACSEAFVPLNGMLEKDNPDKPSVPNAETIAELKKEAGKQLGIAADYIQTCGYHRRDEELAELQAVLEGSRTFASLPPRV